METRLAMGPRNPFPSFLQFPIKNSLRLRVDRVETKVISQTGASLLRVTEDRFLRASKESLLSPLAHSSSLGACCSLTWAPLSPTALPLHRTVWVPGEGGKPGRRRGRQNMGGCEGPDGGRRGGGVPNCTGGKRLANNLICTFTSPLLWLCLSPGRCGGWQGGRLGIGGKENTEGALLQGGPSFPLPTAAHPQSGAVCWSWQTFLSLQNKVIASVCEWKARHIYHRKREKDRRKGEKIVCEQQLLSFFWVRELFASFQTFCCFFLKLAIPLTHTLGGCFLILLLLLLFNQSSTLTNLCQIKSCVNFSYFIPNFSWKEGINWLESNQGTLGMK